MDPALLASLINIVGTQGIPLILKLKGDIEAGRKATTVTDEDLKELDRLARQTSADILARVGVASPTVTRG